MAIGDEEDRSIETNEGRGKVAGLEPPAPPSQGSMDEQDSAESKVGGGTKSPSKSRDKREDAKRREESSAKDPPKPKKPDNSKKRDSSTLKDRKSKERSPRRQRSPKDKRSGSKSSKLPKEPNKKEKGRKNPVAPPSNGARQRDPDLDVEEPYIEVAPNTRSVESRSRSPRRKSPIPSQSLNAEQMSALFNIFKTLQKRDSVRHRSSSLEEGEPPSRSRQERSRRKGRRSVDRSRSRSGGRDSRRPSPRHSRRSRSPRHHRARSGSPHRALYDSRSPRRHHSRSRSPRRSEPKSHSPTHHKHRSPHHHHDKHRRSRHRDPHREYSRSHSRHCSCGPHHSSNSGPNTVYTRRDYLGPRSGGPSSHRQTGQCSYSGTPSSGSLVIGATKLGKLISKKTLEKIKGDEYVDLSDFVNAKKTRTADPGYTINLHGEGGPSFHPLTNKSALTEHQWLSAFTEYMSLYTQYWEDATQDILAYFHLILTMMGQGEDWREYDVIFRKQRDSSPHRWSDVLLDKRFDSVIRARELQNTNSKQSLLRSGFRDVGAGSQNVPSSGGRAPGSTKTGHCFAYHDPNRRCPNPEGACPYSHRCELCNMLHPKFMHNKAQRDPRTTRFVDKEGHRFERRREPMGKATYANPVQKARRSPDRTQK